MKNFSLRKISKFIYFALVQINDTPQKIALGLGLGVFSGVLPGTGVAAALFLSFLFRANRASAIIACSLTNTWLSILTFVLAIKAGSGILGIDWHNIQQDWNYFLSRFNWLDLLKTSALKVILPVIIGYLLVGLCLGLITYSIALMVAYKIKAKLVKKRGEKNAD